MSLSIGLFIPYHAFVQTFLSTLNTLFRHVHGFLEEIGQGVQHIASRVDNIISFVQEANDRRKIFGEVGIHDNDAECRFLSFTYAYLLNHPLSFYHHIIP